MKLLLLGGTVFLGRHIVEAALARGHEVTLFNRGQHNPDLFPELEKLRGDRTGDLSGYMRHHGVEESAVEKLRGDRTGDLSSLEGRRWDAAIDTCGYFPRAVRASTTVLRDSIDHYTFISSISVYADFTRPGLDESSPVGTLADESVEEVTGETYGPLKALCEQAAEQVMPGRVLAVRAGLIVGPDDPTDRFTYWPQRVSLGGEVLVPGSPDDPIQFIDVRDLAEWIVRMVEARQTGVYNAKGPEYRLTMQRLLEECRTATASDARFTWVGEALGADPEINFQPWVPSEYVGMNTANSKRAFAAGLTFRPLGITIRDTLAWKSARPSKDSMRSGLKPDQEQALLQAWHASN